METYVVRHTDVFGNTTGFDYFDSRSEMREHSCINGFYPIFEGIYPCDPFTFEYFGTYHVYFTIE